MTRCDAWLVVSDLLLYTETDDVGTSLFILDELFQIQKQNK